MFEVVKRVYNNFARFSVRESLTDYWIFQLLLALLLATTILFNLAIISGGASSSSGLIFSATITGLNLVVGIFAVYLIATIPSMQGASKNEFEGGIGIGAVSLQQQFSLATTGPDVW